MQKRCFVGIAMDMCEPCDGDTACMQARGQQGEGVPALMRTTPECAELMQLASGFMPKRRLRSYRRSALKINKSLINAIDNGEIETVKLLLRQGADANAYDLRYKREDKDTALSVAIGSLSDGIKAVAIMKLLLKSGANPNLSSYSRHSPLHHAVWSGRSGLQKLKVLLADPKTNPNVETKWGTTPLTLAITNVYKEDALILMKDSRTNLNYVNKDGQTPLGVAYCLNRDSDEKEWNIKKLRKYGATICAGCSRCP
jgi:ankyrin repeat protein